MNKIEEIKEKGIEELNKKLDDCVKLLELTNRYDDVGLLFVETVKKVSNDFLCSHQFELEKAAREEVIEQIKKLPIYMKVAGNDLSEPKEALLKDDVLQILTQ